MANYDQYSNEIEDQRNKNENYHLESGEVSAPVIVNNYNIVYQPVFVIDQNMMGNYLYPPMVPD